MFNNYFKIWEKVKYAFRLKEISTIHTKLTSTINSFIPQKVLKIK